jgi:hypothetical protein
MNISKTPHWRFIFLRSKLSEISNSVTLLNEFQLIKPTRRHQISDGVLMYEHEEWKEKFIYLFNDGLLLCDSKNKMENYFDFTTSPYSWMLTVKDNHLEDEKLKQSIQLIHQEETIILLVEKKKEFLELYSKVMDEILKEKKLNSIERSMIQFQKEKIVQRQRKSIFQSFKRDAPPTISCVPRLERKEEEMIQEKEMLKEKENILGIGFISEDVFKVNADELKLNQGDLVEINSTLKLIQGHEYYVCSKVGMNIYPYSYYKRDYSDYCDIYYKEKKKKVYPHYFNLDDFLDPPPIYLKKEIKKCNLEDRNEFIQGITHLYSEYNQFGLVPKSVIQLFSHSFNLDILDFIQKRDDEEESKIRNFKIKKKEKSKRDNYMENYEKGLSLSKSLMLKKEKKRKLSAPSALEPLSDSDGPILLFPSNLPRHLSVVNVSTGSNTTSAPTSPNNNTPVDRKEKVKSLFVLKKK